MTPLKTPAERDDEGLIGLVEELHTRVSKYGNREVHTAWQEAKVELTRRMADSRSLQKIRSTLISHPLMSVECNHEDKTDTPQCGCCSLQFPAFPSVGEAVAAWADHVIDVLNRQVESRHEPTQ